MFKIILKALPFIISSFVGWSSLVSSSNAAEMCIPRKFKKPTDIPCPPFWSRDVAGVCQPPIKTNLQPPAPPKWKWMVYSVNYTGATPQEACGVFSAAHGGTWSQTTINTNFPGSNRNPDPLICIEAKTRTYYEITYQPFRPYAATPTLCTKSTVWTYNPTTGQGVSTTATDWNCGCASTSCCPTGYKYVLNTGAPYQFTNKFETHGWYAGCYKNTVDPKPKDGPCDMSQNPDGSYSPDPQDPDCSGACGGNPKDKGGPKTCTGA